MSTLVKEWLKKEQKVGAYYLFEDKQIIGEKFYNALVKKRGKGFYTDDDTRKEGFIASVYGIYELFYIADNFYSDSSQQKRAIPLSEQLSLANEIKEIYDHIDKYGYDFAPIISNSINEKFFRVTEPSVNQGKRQKYPYYGAMTWILSLSSLLWRKYFSYTETGIVEQIDSKREIISDPEAVKIIRSLEDTIRDTMRRIIKLFSDYYIAPEDIGELDFHNYGNDNKKLISLAAEDGLKLGWGYTKGMKNPSLYFTFSVLEAYSDFDSNIMIGGDNEDYFFATPGDVEKGLETTKNESAYVRGERFYNNLIEYINSEIKKDEHGHEVIGPDGKPVRVPGKVKYEEKFRKAATQCAYYLFYKFKDTISDSFYNDDGYIVSRQQVQLSSTSSSVFYPLYILSSLLNGEVNGTVKTQLMYTRKARNEFVSHMYTDKESLALLAEMDRQIQALESEYRQFEACFTDGLNNVQKIYSYMEKNDKLDVIDRHYLTFDQIHPENAQFSRMLSRENIMAMPLLPLLVNVTNLYVLWFSKFPDKQISAYIMDVFENYCNHAEDGSLEWVFEQGNYDLHATVRYIDAISNFFSYYESYERSLANLSKARSEAEKKVREELEPRYQERLEKRTIAHKKEIESLNKEIAALKSELEAADNKYNKVFNIENDTLLRLAEILNQYVDGKHAGNDTPHAAAIETFCRAALRVAALKLASDGDPSDMYAEEFVNGLKFMFEKRGQREGNSLTSFFKNIIEKDGYIFWDIGKTKSDQD